MAFFPDRVRQRKPPHFACTGAGCSMSSENVHFIVNLTQKGTEIIHYAMVYALAFNRQYENVLEKRPCSIK